MGEAHSRGTPPQQENLNTYNYQTECQHAVGQRGARTEKTYSVRSMVWTPQFANALKRPEAFPRCLPLSRSLSFLRAQLGPWLNQVHDSTGNDKGMTPIICRRIRANQTCTNTGQGFELEIQPGESFELGSGHQLATSHNREIDSSNSYRRLNEYKSDDTLNDPTGGFARNSS